MTYTKILIRLSVNIGGWEVTLNKRFIGNLEQLFFKPSTKGVLALGFRDIRIIVIIIRFKCTFDRSILWRRVFIKKSCVILSCFWRKLLFHQNTKGIYTSTFICTSHRLNLKSNSYATQILREELLCIRIFLMHGA
jgi:hypothetical protein